MRARITVGGYERHPMGCDCGDCNDFGVAYEAEIFDVDAGEVYAHVYGPSEPVAEARAVVYARANGYRIVERKA